MPALNVATGAKAPGPVGRKHSGGQPNNATAQPARSSSPVRPPISPIPPPLNATGLPAVPPFPTASGQLSNPAALPFGQGRPSFAHPSQADMAQPGMSMVPPPAPAISFDENPDALALQSAISILQMQRAKATGDIQALARAKRAALADPRAFATDLAAGRVRTEGDRLFVEDGAGDSGSDMEEESDDDSADDDEDQESEPSDEDESGDVKMEMGPGPSIQGESSAQGAAAAASKSAKARRKRKGKQKSSDAGPSRTAATDAKAWRRLPKPQNVVRCPPINWTQYGVVGESLDKLHAEQRAAPTLGKPAMLGPGGTFEFRAGDTVPTGGQQRRLVGVAAPYAPGKDKIDKKKGKR
jgi:hypothetical protein